MTEFTQIRNAAESIWGAEEIQRRLASPVTAAELRRRPDHEYLSLMSRRIFRAGLRHSMVDGRWPAFEKAFRNFSVEQVRMFSDEMLDTLMRDRTIIRHWAKIKSVRANAQAIYELGTGDYRFGGFLAGWPERDCTGLWDELKNRFTQLGGNSGPYFLRMAGRDTFLLSSDVVRGLNTWGVVSGTVKNRKSRQVVQQCFNDWRDETGLPFCQLSMILALSTT